MRNRGQLRSFAPFFICLNNVNAVVHEFSVRMSERLRAKGEIALDGRLDFFEGEPIIAAVKSEEQLNRAIASDCNIIFFLFGNICNIASLVQRVADAGKRSLVHVDLINGLAAKEIAADFIRSFTPADGIISTKPQLLRHAREVGLITVLRVFVLDSMALDNIDKLRTSCNPDLIELVPGIAPKIIRLVNSLYHTPIIAGGLIRDKEDTMNALSAGAMSISTSCEAAWREMGVS